MLLLESMEIRSSLLWLQLWSSCPETDGVLDARVLEPSARTHAALSLALLATAGFHKRLNMEQTTDASKSQSVLALELTVLSKFRSRHCDFWGLFCSAVF